MIAFGLKHSPASANKKGTKNFAMRRRLHLFLARHKALLLFAFALSLVNSATWAHDTTLSDEVKPLVILPLHYGANNLSVAGRPVLITRGYFNTGTAGSGDVYAIMVHESEAEDDHSNDWEMVRYEGTPADRMLTITAPHTYEDSIMSVRFMVPKDAKGENFPALYMLKAEKIFPPRIESLPGNHKVSFTLYKLWRDDDFGIFYLHEISHDRSQKTYCNVDWALQKEFAIPPADDTETYKCEDTK